MIYARLLSLGQINKRTTEIVIAEKPEKSKVKKGVAITAGILATTSQVAFTEATYVGITRLFPETTSPAAIAAAAIAAAFSLLPNVGFGFSTGYQATHAIASKHKPLADLYFAKTRIAIKCTIDFLALFAGGTSFSVAMNAEKDLATVTSMNSTLNEFLKWTIAPISYTTGAVVTAYYMLCLCVEILCYFAQRCTDEHIRRLFTFVAETRHMHTVLHETTEANYLEILRWKLTGQSELSDVLHCIFENRMSTKEYLKTQSDVNVHQIIMVDAQSTPKYRLLSSLFKPVENTDESTDEKRDLKVVSIV
jgi:hypothetical protein